MPLADYFRRIIPDDPYVQGGVMSRGQNWQMRLGSLAAALGNMDRPGMLGQALAQAGAIYQDQRQGALQAAIERQAEEAKAQREHELYRQKQEEYEYNKNQREIEEQDRLAKIELEVTSREAMRRRLSDLGLPMQYADNPTMANAAIQEAEMAARPQKEDSPNLQFINAGRGQGAVFNPQTGALEPRSYPYSAPAGGGDGEYNPADIDALIAERPDLAAAIRLNPQVAASQRLQQGYEPKPKPAAATDPRKDLESRAKDALEDEVWVAQFEQQNGRAPDYADAVTEAARRRSIVEGYLGPKPQFQPGTSGLESIRRAQPGAQVNRERVQELRGGTKPVKAQGGESVAGMHMPSPDKSTLGSGKMGMLKGTPKKTEAQATGLARLEGAVETAKTVLPPEQAAMLGPVIKRMVDEGMDPEEIADYIERQVRLVAGRG